MPALNSPRLPNIVFLLTHAQPLSASSSLAATIWAVSRERDLDARVAVHDQPAPELLPFARTLAGSGEADVFVCQETAGRYLRSHLDVPVALMRPNGFDLMRALHEAAQLADRVAVFSRGTPRPELTALGATLNLQVHQYSYSGTSDARRLLIETQEAGVRVVIGSSMVIEYAQAHGLAGILSTERNAVRQALDDALAFHRRAVVESARQRQLDTMLAHIDEGIVMLDGDDVVQAANPAILNALGSNAGHVLGRRLADAAPVLADGVRAGEPTVLTVGSRALVVESIPVLTDGAVTGRVLKCQDTESVERADRRIRSSRRERRFVARYHLYQLLGESESVRTMARLAERYARTQATVLITGESGTGKELLAQGIHNAGPRHAAPFVAINCAALPENLLESELFGYEEGAFSGSRKGGKPGLFELAHDGTLFLDEIGDMPLSLQTRLLRVLQEQEVLRLGGTQPTPVNVRVIAATHRDLAARIAAGEFREDLYYRLNILRLHAPPLRERRQDIPELARHLATDAVRRLGLPVDTRALLRELLPAMQAYAWPGNVRELANVVERGLVAIAAMPERDPMPAQLRLTLPELYGGTHTAMAAPAAPPAKRAMSAAAPLRERLREVGRAEAQRALDACGGDRAATAASLGISRATLWRRLRG
ncbi:propionate catabolism operon regulatory protein PrpR [Verticiella sediminum]|uniref:Propionate catabolism operon regulatory protein PrpR n=1 Tax=Verticiella sediminum TaxID=1247510 RepID=A0A556AM01_9BURK|nr:propionate catabolism operon regulatory protein PrpR [Verticiella sediminum]TSH93912.1 propionate catabolism operon regulatory protein PrpR [Verticiella sediminum]